MNIDDLYKKHFVDSGEGPSGTDWEEMNRMLKRKLFFRFRPAKFNIYYLLLLFSLSGFASYSGYRSYVLHKEIRRIRMNESHDKRSIDSLKHVIEEIKPDTVRIESVPERREKNRSMVEPDTLGKKEIPLLNPQGAKVKHMRKTTVIKTTVIKQTDTLKMMD